MQKNKAMPLVDQFQTRTSGGGGVTKVGNNCLLMVGTHIAHDCIIGNNVIFANHSTLAGHVIIENNVIYVADNMGYLYAINYIDKKVIWAKNYKKPFRSNLKITQDDLLVADQDNLFYFINKYDGNKRKSIPTEEVILKNNFYNSLANDNSNIFYLNTFGSLYSINVNDKNIPVSS